MFESLEGTLTWIVSGGGAGWLAYWIVERIPTESWDPFWKRMVAFGLTGLLAVAAVLLAVAMGYQAGCAEWRCWLEQIVATVGLAITTSQVVHGARKLERKSRAEEPAF